MFERFGNPFQSIWPWLRVLVHQKHYSVLDVVAEKLGTLYLPTVTGSLQKQKWKHEESCSWSHFAEHFESLWEMGWLLKPDQCDKAEYCSYKVWQVANMTLDSALVDCSYPTCATVSTSTDFRWIDSKKWVQCKGSSKYMVNEVSSTCLSLKKEKASSPLNHQ